MSLLTLCSEKFEISPIFVFFFVRKRICGQNGIELAIKKQKTTKKRTQKKEKETRMFAVFTIPLTGLSYSFHQQSVK